MSIVLYPFIQSPRKLNYNSSRSLSFSFPQTSRPDELFVRLHGYLTQKFPDIPLPAIARAGGLFSEVNPRDRVVELDKFIKAVVARNEFVLWHPTLEFLGDCRLC